MSLDTNYKISKTGNAYILYDADIIAEPALQIFEANYHTNKQAQQNNSTAGAASGRTGIGRASVVYFTHDDKALVLKHYYRGGAVASLFKDRYLGFSVVKSRAFKEWRLLKKMQQLGLPVPQAVAAHVKKSLLSYTADLITEEIKQARTLADILSETGIEAAQWHKIGDRIRLFHLHDVYHADLNARNILLAATAQHPRPEAGDVYLIDFDNSGFRPGSGSWKMANLARLKRSLLKFKRNDAGFNFDEADWSALLAGYKSGVAE
jgi:tRNA A-37 threonylcarbamoyl transferase component Bud32